VNALILIVEARDEIARVYFDNLTKKFNSNDPLVEKRNRILDSVISQGRGIQEHHNVVLISLFPLLFGRLG